MWLMWGGGGRTLLAKKSMRSSTLDWEGGFCRGEEMVFHNSLNVEGGAVWDDEEEEDEWESSEEEEDLLLKAQFLPLIGNTTTLALIVKQIGLSSFMLSSSSSSLTIRRAE